MKRINILCFGDSLTEGYSQWGIIWSPYAKNMRVWLEASWPETEMSVDVAGMSGDYVRSPLGRFLPRIQARCSVASPHYDWIIILGGTNDLSDNCITPSEIFSSLQAVYTVAFQHGANVLALTVPECAAVNARLNARRNELNELIKGYEHERFYTLDIHTLLPYHSLSASDREAIWDDGLHLTPYGYGVLGDHVANQLVELVNTVENPQNLYQNDRSTKAESKEGEAQGSENENADGSKLDEAKDGEEANGVDGVNIIPEGELTDEEDRPKPAAEKEQELEEWPEGKVFKSAERLLDSEDEAEGEAYINSDGGNERWD